MKDNSSLKLNASSLATTEVGAGIAADLYRRDDSVSYDRLLELELLGLRLLGLA
jgi:hypothetical protein